MIYKVLDAEKDITAQGFLENSYDMIICSLVLHTSRDLECKMRDVRRLLKSGGYLVMLEVINPQPMRMGFAVSGMPGWWLGKDDGRELSPCVPASSWNSVLRNSGFSGIDAITPEVDMLPRPFGVIVTQAVDKHMNLICQPLAFPATDTQTQEVVIVGGSTPRTSMLMDDLEKILKSHYKNLRRIENLECLKEQEIVPIRSFLSQIELDEPIFKSIFDKRLGRISDLTVRAQSSEGQAYGHASKAYIYSFTPPLRDEIIGVYSDSLKVVWIVAIAIAAASFFFVFVEKDIKLRTELETEFGLKTKSKKGGNLEQGGEDAEAEKGIESK